LLTGQRRNEIGKLQWSEIDLSRKLIVLASGRTKNGRQHEVPLAAQAQVVVDRYPRRNSSDFLFGKRGFSDWSVAKAKLDQRVGVAPWTLHDLRRSAATYMAEIGVLPHIVEAVLNHQSGHKASVAGVYNRARYEEQMRDALQRWADWLERVAA
jgi:integrase